MFWLQFTRIATLNDQLGFVVLIMGWLKATCNTSLLVCNWSCLQADFFEWIITIKTSNLFWFICRFASFTLYDSRFDHAILYRIRFLELALLWHFSLLLFWLLLLELCSRCANTSNRFLKFVRNFVFFLALFWATSFLAARRLVTLAPASFTMI